MTKTLKFILATLIALIAYPQTNAQELRCNIQLITTQVQGSNKSITENLQTALYELVNNRNWTSHVFSQQERIECNMMFNITSMIGTEFSGTLQVQARRPVYNSSYSSTLFNIQDKNIKFSYIDGQPLEFNETSFTSNLVAIVAFYAYIVLGLDYDSFAYRGGQEFFAKAERIVTLAQQSGETGWKPYEGNYKNRYWLIQNIMDDRYLQVREFNYKYHRLGLDRLSSRLTEARGDIAKYMELLQEVYRRKPDQYMYFMQVFTDAKADEWINIFSNATSDEKTRVVRILKEIDSANSSKYEKISK